MEKKKQEMSLLQSYKAIRSRTEIICQPLKTEDYVVQPVVDVSPPKWHLGHTTWFFETLVLKPFVVGYKEFDPNYNYVFNSYYETLGARVMRTDRGNLSRPSVEDVYRYRAYVDEAMHTLLSIDLETNVTDTVVLGLNHEEQHQELLWTDIKYILGHNPLFPAYADESGSGISSDNPAIMDFIDQEEGIYKIGHVNNAFCFDNELGAHRVFLEPFSISSRLVTNGEYVAFIEAGGYADHRWWHAEGLDWVRQKSIMAPMYWHLIDGKWHYYTLNGLKELDMSAEVCHVSFFEASAYAAWKGMRLPTEFEWEIASGKMKWGSRWEWTNSAYLPYPGFLKAEGAAGEYNGKFMVNQMALRGASEVTPPGHGRYTYRNFFHPHLRWQYTGIRLAK